MPADAIVQASKQLTDTLRGNIPPQLVEISIDQLRHLTSIFGDTAEAYEQRHKEDEETIGITANSPSVPKSTPPPRVEQTTTKQAKNYAHDVPNLVVSYDSDSDEEEDREPTRLVVASKEVAARPRKGTPLPEWMPHYITQDCANDAPSETMRARRTRSEVRSITDDVILSCMEMLQARISP